ncbi:hypothetical protein [Neisseria elongata]|jgi:hypothetical protein|uniref:hypothetical protein n=1 Tax=Neisseria elongata TaxID=495 RepID=UPI00131AD143|nr:hypothetical protein [Neisseria elongata]
MLWKHFQTASKPHIHQHTPAARPDKHTILLIRPSETKYRTVPGFYKTQTELEDAEFLHSQHKAS